MKIFVYGVIGVVAVAVIAGFFVVGSPNQERMRQFDERRVSDLQGTQYEIVNYWQAKQKLPEKLLDIKDEIRGIGVPQDPQTNAAYEYAVKGATQFELCATFSLSRDAARFAGDEWTHPAGRHCFTRTIDKDLYPPLVKTQQ